MSALPDVATWPRGGVVEDRIDPPCVVRNDSNDYHHGAGLSRTELLRILKTPYHFHALHEREHGDEDIEAKPTEQMFAGTLMHCALLERAEFDRRYAVGPEVSTRASKEWKQFVAGLLPAVEPISPLQRKLAYAQSDALLAIPAVRELLECSLILPEHAGYWIDDKTGALCKCRPDLAVLVGDNAETWGWVLVDAKSTGSASPESFASSVVNFAYAEQAAWYTHGWGRATGLPVHAFLFACVESAYPHATALYQLPDASTDSMPDWLGYGWRRCREALDIWSGCNARNEWPGYPQTVQLLPPPDWRWLRNAMENA